LLALLEPIHSDHQRRLTIADKQLSVEFIQLRHDFIEPVPAHRVVLALIVSRFRHRRCPIIKYRSNSSLSNQIASLFDHNHPLTAPCQDNSCGKTKNVKKSYQNPDEKLFWIPEIEKNHQEIMKK
jgi:hypothetical protein